MIQASSAFSPFAGPRREYDHFFAQLALESGPAYGALRSGFPKFDQALDGIHGINVIGGPPSPENPVLPSRLQPIWPDERCRCSTMIERACQEFQELLVSFRVVNDRKLNALIMRRHIDFIRHETRSEYTVVVIDSLHKLPFKDFTEQRTGIDAWLRQLEAIRDELQVSFLMLSELSRGHGDGYSDMPHMGVFKGSGDIEYSADNALVLSPDWDSLDSAPHQQRQNKLWLVASREHTPGLVASYGLDYPYWGFTELDEQGLSE